MKRTIIWTLALAAVLAAGLAMTFSPEPTISKAYAQESKKP